MTRDFRGVAPNSMLDASRNSCVERCAVRGARVLALAFAMTSAAHVARAEPSKISPEVGYGYGQTENARIAAMGGALRAFSQSTEALYINPANMAVTRVYHLGAHLNITPEAGRLSGGAAIVDSIVSESRLSGGLGISALQQDPSGIGRTNLDARFALAYPFSEHFFIGGAARYLSLKQDGFPRGL